MHSYYKNSLIGQGLLDWNYYPLTDWQHTLAENTTNEIILNAGINYKLLKGLDVVQEALASIKE